MINRAKLRGKPLDSDCKRANRTTHEYGEKTIESTAKEGSMIRRTIPKHTRQQVYEKYGGHCAYCGKALKYKDMQVDHLIPLRSGGADEMKNYMPACRRCNHYKRSSSLETFREMIEKIPEKLQRDSYIFKVGVDYGFFEVWDRNVTFYFENYKLQHRSMKGGVEE